ncbi:MAG TPA: hypothetical protein VJN96_16795 [Vicinamibacterales bacterium]|nr:hypothetical protein [Vicinamibacterales bacterium]
MRSPSGAFSWLLAKEWRLLMASRSWWILLALVGPLVGVSFIGAVHSYAEISAGAGAGCGIVCDPLIGIWGPTFGAYELAAVFFLPFVAIRVVSGDRLSGALKLELQHTMPMAARVAAKVFVILAGWLVTYAAALTAIVLWRGYGGSVYVPELLVVALGHTLNAALTIALAVAVAAMTEHPSTAAIVTLAITIGTWIIDFQAAVHGDWWERLAAFTPAAMVATFQHALLLVNVSLITVVLFAVGVALAGIWLQLGASIRQRVLRSAAVVAAAAIVTAVAALVPGYWDASESRLNSFPEPAQEALHALPAPLTIEAHLAAQDPRRTELERVALAKLRRALPGVKVVYTSRTTTALYEQSDPGYGEIWYELGGKRVMSRIITEEGVLETIFGLAGVTPAEESEGLFAGHPLVSRPAGAAWAFYGIWPVLVAGAYWVISRRQV